MVADCWLRQLTVCPGVSVEKAQLIRQRFPTFRAFVEFYRKGDPMDGQILVNECSLLTLATSKQLLAFLQRAHSIEWMNIINLCEFIMIKLQRFFPNFVYLNKTIHLKSEFFEKKTHLIIKFKF